MEAIWLAIRDFFTDNETAWRILFILVLAFFLWWGLRFGIKQAVDRFVHGVKKAQATDSTAEISTSGLVRERAIQRTRTLGAVGRSVITWIIVAVTLVLVLHEFGIDLTAILASAGFIGAGLAFGAQSIVKDVLNGIFMVFEDQIGVGDYITVGEVSGTVEDVGVRITQVRALDGTLWFVRNGEILTLGNMSQGYGQAVIDITVAANTDLERAQTAALESAKQAIQIPEIRRKVTGTPEMWGVQALAGDRATIRLTIRTRPEVQGAVSRAVRLQIQKYFQEQGLELAPQTVNILRPGNA
ncbi:mechanosensitive ion channel family protein [Canibacter zhoujuaniae]|uniref:mechanosensitive ion channel family protein n=1 Tax=Canibacter zhoujuaniae TaxID=2708343 RepID=UPI0014205A1A|nr:mechanosensitive ion channel family protein [Canibacter zhoujuaniae]